MIKEFAVDPEVMASWKNFQLLWDDFGVGRGRLISRYPKAWNKTVYELAQQLNADKPVRASSLCEKIRSAPHKFIPSRRDFDPAMTWLDNAEACSTARPFDAIIAQVNSRSNAAVVAVDDLDKEKPPFKVKTWGKISRTASEMLRCARLLLENSDEIILVDPYFDAGAARFQNPLLEFLAIRPAGRPWKRCEFHTYHREKDSATHLANRIYNCRRHLPECVPAGNTLRLHFWTRNAQGEEMHPRFLLTELGGIKFDFGLDEGDGVLDTTIATLVDHDFVQTLRADYTSPSPTFQITPDCIVEIVGSG